METKISIRVTGASMGSVMYRNRCHRDAPSIMADSYSSRGMVCRPAWSTRAAKGHPFQMAASITAYIALLPTSQMTGSSMMPSFMSHMLTRPMRAWKMKRQTL